MAKFNTSFELTIRDIELIESALKLREKEISMQQLATGDAGGADRQTLADIHTLLGRLHNQKVFYRPKAGTKAPFVSG